MPVFNVFEFLSAWLFLITFSKFDSIILTMGKRLQRILNTEIANNLDKLQNKEVDIILSDNSTLHGYIKQISSQKAVLEDKRFTTHKLSLDNIVEIVFDFEAAN